MADLCGYLSLEQGGHILCENSDNLVTECFVAPVSSLIPGKVWKGRYPYWKSKPVPYRPPYSVPYNFREEEEFLIIAASELD